MATFTLSESFAIGMFILRQLWPNSNLYGCVLGTLGHGEVSPREGETLFKEIFPLVNRAMPSKKGASVDVAAYNGWTPLFAAAAMLADSLEIVKYLHLSGARVG